MTEHSFEWSDLEKIVNKTLLDHTILRSVTKTCQPIENSREKKEEKQELREKYLTGWLSNIFLLS